MGFVPIAKRVVPAAEKAIVKWKMMWVLIVNNHVLFVFKRRMGFNLVRDEGVGERGGFVGPLVLFIFLREFICFVEG